MRIRTFPLTVAHTGTGALANCLRAVDGKGPVTRGNDFSFSHFFALADDIIACGNDLYDSSHNYSNSLVIM